MKRRLGSPVAWLVYGLTALFVLLPLGPALLGRGTLIDVGALSGILPFRAEAGRQLSSTVVCRWDTFDYYMPGIAEIKRSFFAGHFPTWAPYEVGGAPLASLPNHGALSPISLPYFVLPLWLAPAYVKLLEFVVAIGGMVLFLRRLGLSTTAGLVAGVVFAGSGFMIMWSNWPHTRVAALIPALFWALERLLQQLQARDVVLVGAVVASMLLGGFPAVVLFAHTLAAPYVLVRAVVLYRDRLRLAVGALLASAAGIALGVGLSAIQILPFAANLGAQDLLVDRDKSGIHLPLPMAITVVDPYVTGTCVGGQRFAPWNPVEGIGFIGGTAIVVAAAALALRRSSSRDSVPTAFMAAAGIVLGIALWFGGPFLTLLQALPFWSTNGVGRAQSVFGFIVAVLVGVAFDRLYRSLTSDGHEPPQRLQDRLVLVRLSVVLLVLAVIGVIVGGAIFEVARRQDFEDHLHARMAFTGLVLVASVAALLLAVLGSLRARMGALITLTVLIIVQSTAFADTLLPPSRVADFYPATPTHAFLTKHLGPDRYGARGTIMLAPTADYYQLRTPVGHEFTDQRWKDLLAAADPQAVRTVTYSSFATALPVEDVARSAALDQLAVRYWVDSPRRTIGIKASIPDSGDGEVALKVGDEASCTLPGGPIRGVRVTLADEMPPTTEGRRSMLHVAVTSDGVERRGAILIDAAIKPGALSVAVAGETLPTSSTASARFWLTDTDGSRVFRGRGDEIYCAAVRPADDDLRLVHADAGGAIYERLDALPRIRWAATSRVVTDGAERVALLKEGVAGDTVLLEDAQLPPGQDQTAELDVLADEREHMSIQIEARGDGYVVVADSIVRPGWRATVDGTPVALVHGNHAFAAIPVPAGSHRVELDYIAPGLKAGVVVSVVSLLLAAVPIAGPTLARRRRRGMSSGSARELP